MARLTLPEIDNPVFDCRLDIRISDINYGGHLGNDAALRFAHEVRLRFLQSLDCTEMDVYGAGIIMSDAAVIYRNEAFHGDTLAFSLGITDFSRCGCDFIYQARRMSDNAAILHIKTGIVFFDYQQRKATAVPAAFAAQFRLKQEGVAT
ncbi:acyl-CoA thioesterase [Vogesella indigofera]|uniref:acyl-CoA thioesterase n=1 Tax=Vogesella indigofera TaxID=45465 RepID=UPI00234E4BEC|nr:thioesterase family protein [Vogesella indigofera]MDC7700447.1 thioesterase family protein [Vogesella indigofera]